MRVLDGRSSVKSGRAYAKVGTLVLALCFVLTGEAAAQVCSGILSNSGEGTFSAGYNRRSGNSGIDGGARLHGSFGAVGLSWLSPGYFGQQRDFGRTATGRQYEEIFEAETGRLGLEASAYHPSAPWVCLTAGVQRLGWSYSRYYLTSNGTFYTGQSDGVDGRWIGVPLGLSAGQPVALGAHASLNPTAAITYVHYQFSVEREAWTDHDWVGSLGVGLAIRGLTLSLRLEQSLREADPATAFRGGMAYTVPIFH